MQVITVEILQLIIQLYISYPILTILNNIVVEGNGIWKIVIMELSGSNWMKEKQNISKNKLAHRAEMQRTQLNQFCKGTVTRLDTAVLARLCCALNCKIEDLLEYVPPENKEK